jgi:hypothetical protein
MRTKKPKLSKPERTLKRTITVAGALIVFITFLINTSLVERYKDLSDAIDRARDVYLLRTDLRTLYLQNAKLEALVINRLGPFKESFVNGAVGSTVEGPNEEYEAKDARWHDSTIILDSSQRLLTRLSLHSEQDAKIALFRKWIAHEKQLEDDDEEINNHEGLLKDDEDTKQRADDLMELEDLRKRIVSDKQAIANDLKTSHHPLEKAVNIFGAEVLQIAEREYERDDDAYHSWKVWSYVLYAVGWALGLAGHFLGEEIPTGGD